MSDPNLFCRDSPLGTAAHPAKPRGLPHNTPPMSRICAETALKHWNIRRVLATARREKEKAKSMQVHLDALLAEKSRREKELQAAIASLPAPNEIAALKTRLDVAREHKRSSAKKINDSDAYLTCVSATTQGEYRGEARQNREYMELKRSTKALKDEVSLLKLQLQELTSNVNKNDVCKESRGSPGSGKKVDESPNVFKKILELKKEKEMWNERIRNATAAWHMATKREAKLTRLLEALKRQVVYKLQPSRNPAKSMKNKAKERPALEEIVADFVSHVESVNFLAASGSHQPEGDSASESPTLTREMNLSRQISRRGSYDQTQRVSFLGMDNDKNCS
ncbi:hypothetical protein MOQ_001961 [Trypanosoma cruzi marinkellei]|uniref:Uncharacterized protein n=1 Tax=Trypanosoma cruzi marinkellei TaxID=85056 RepID=K2NJA1_TRYCR|nr:hypothetical protein MOQ_001961 [Trypanosoma cruzi marinkellei]